MVTTRVDCLERSQVRRHRGTSSSTTQGSPVLMVEWQSVNVHTRSGVSVPTMYILPVKTVTVVVTVPVWTWGLVSRYRQDTRWFVVYGRGDGCTRVDVTPRPCFSLG